MASSIAFIDPRVSNYLDLAKTFDGSVGAVLLNANENGLRQIADRLEGRSGVEAVHIVSHGGTASIQPGSSELSSSNLSAHEHLLSRIGSALCNDADILPYWCDAASGPEGRAFVEQLETGVDAVASDDSTDRRSLAATRIWRSARIGRNSEAFSVDFKLPVEGLKEQCGFPWPCHPGGRNTLRDCAPRTSSRLSRNRPTAKTFPDQGRSLGKSAGNPRRRGGARCVRAWKSAIDWFEARGPGSTGSCPPPSGGFGASR